MNLSSIAWRQLLSRPLFLTATSVTFALAIALMIAVNVVGKDLNHALKKEAAYCDLIMGAHGSPLQSVLSSIYHLDKPTGNIPKTHLKVVANNPSVELAVPISLGDNLKGFRIIGTTQDFFKLKGLNASEPLMKLKEGRLFERSFEAVLGSTVAQKLQLSIGDTFQGKHGIDFNQSEATHDQFSYQVVGIAAPSHTSQDKGIFVDQASVWAVHQQEIKTHSVFKPIKSKPTKKASDEVTAILIQLKSPGSRLWLMDKLAKETATTVASPLEEIFKLIHSFIQPVLNLFTAVSWGLAIVVNITLSTLMIVITYTHRREYVIARSLGGSFYDLLKLQIMNVGGRVLLGLILGVALAYGGLLIAYSTLQASLGLSLTLSYPSSDLFWQLGGAVVGAFIAVLLPVVVLYRKNAAELLS